MRITLFKIIVLVIGFGVISLGLLVLRQSRLQAAHELAQTRIRMLGHDAELLKVRSQISQLSTPWLVGERLPDEPVAAEPERTP